MSALRIGINALYLIPGGVGGTEIYLRSLLEALETSGGEHRYVVFINRESAVDPPTRSPRFEVVPCTVSASNRPQRILWEQFVFPGVLRRNRIDVLFNPGFTVPVLFSGPSVTVFHDLQHKRHPGFFRWFDLPFWNLLLWAAARRSRGLIAVSEATAVDLERYYPGTAVKTRVVQHGVDPALFDIGRARKGSPDKYVLTVSTLHPHKNIARLLQAFAQFHITHPEYRLIVAGRKGFAAAELEQRRKELGLETSVVFTGWVARDALYDLYLHAHCYIAPSEFEGFGMPILEALAAGIPSACSRIAPLDGIAGPAAVQFDPHSVHEIAAALERIATDAAFRAQALTAGPARAAEFSWNRTAEQTVDALESVTSNRVQTR